MDALDQRLDALKASGRIAGWQPPHRNHGASGGMLPWVVMPASGGPASTFYNRTDLSMAVSALETFGSFAYLNAHVTDAMRERGVEV